MKATSILELAKTGESQEPEEFVNPATGVSTMSDSPAGMIEELHLIQALESELRGYSRALKFAIAKLSPGTGTTHLCAGRYNATIRHPTENWDKTKLRQVWDDFAGNPHRNKLLRIESVALNKTPWKKALATKGDVRLDTLKEAIAEAEGPPTQAPTIQIKVVGK